MQKEKIKPILENTALFSGVSKRTIGRALTCPVLRFDAKEEICQGDEPAMFLVLAGRVRIASSPSADGVILNTLTRRYLFGVGALFGSEPPATHALALTRCTLLAIPQSRVEEMLAGDFIFTKNYIAFLSERIRFLNQKIAAFTVGSCEGKLARYLLSLPHEGNTLTLPMSLPKLSLTLGMGRASLYRAFDRLTQLGHITKDGRRVTFTDYPAFYAEYGE